MNPTRTFFSFACKHTMSKRKKLISVIALPPPYEKYIIFKLPIEMKKEREKEQKKSSSRRFRALLINRIFLHINHAAFIVCNLIFLAATSH